MKIKPISDHILIEPMKEEEKTKAGILLPDTAEKEPEQGRVVAVGPGKKDKKGNLIPLEVKVGDKVLFRSFDPHRFKADGKEYLIAKEEEILAVIE